LEEPDAEESLDSSETTGRDKPVSPADDLQAPPQENAREENSQTNETQADPGTEVDPEIAAKCEHMREWIRTRSPKEWSWVNDHWPWDGDTSIPSLKRPELHTRNTLDAIVAVLNALTFARVDGGAPSRSDMYDRSRDDPSALSFAV
jgi:hypothetical protein